MIYSYSDNVLSWSKTHFSADKPLFSITCHQDSKYLGKEARQLAFYSDDHSLNPADDQC